MAPGAKDSMRVAGEVARVGIDEFLDTDPRDSGDPF
jgi:hypothetical protein